jgi:hypothetical protein
MVSADVLFDEDFETMAVGTLADTTHPGWTGMIEGNQAGQPITDWKIVEGAGLDWVAADGGMISGGNRHFEMKSLSNITGRAFRDLDPALPTDIGEPTSIYLRYCVSFDRFENIANPDDDTSVWPLVRFNGSWQMRSIVKFRHRDYDAGNDELRFLAELHDDVDKVAGTTTHAFLEDKLGEPQPMTTYLVVTRYDFDAAGVLQGQSIWVNPNSADMGTPDLVSNHSQPGYDTFVNPIVSMDITTYTGTMRYDNIKVATAWDDVVPQAGGGTVFFDEDFETMAVGTLADTTHPGWTGMIEGNQAGQPITDWKIVEGAGLDWVAADGGMISGGNRHFEMKSLSNITGRAFRDLDPALPTDIGEPTSIYLRYCVSFDRFENIANPDDDTSVWPLVRFNGSWQMRSIVKFRHRDYDAGNDELRFLAELHDDVDKVAGTTTHAFLEDKLGEPQPMTTYLVVTRYDFDAAGVLQGQSIWVNPNSADMGTPDLVSNHSQPGYDTFVNPIVSMDITTYTGTMRYDNIKIADSWNAVVPQASGGATWALWPVANEIMDVNTGAWMGWINVFYAPWIYSYNLDQWLFIEESAVTESGGWAYVFNF